MNCPGIRFEKRCNLSIMGELERSSLWAAEWNCPGKTAFLTRGAISWLQRWKKKRLTWLQVRKKGRWIGCPKKARSHYLDALQKEWIKLLDVFPAGKLRSIEDNLETRNSRNSYQRGNEHLKEIKEGIIIHPIVKHEEYEGRFQEVLMRVLSIHHWADKYRSPSKSYRQLNLLRKVLTKYWRGV